MDRNQYVRHALHWPKALSALIPLQVDTGGLAGVTGGFAGGFAAGLAGAAGGLAFTILARALSGEEVRCV